MDALADWLESNGLKIDSSNLLDAARVAKTLSLCLARSNEGMQMIDAIYDMVQVNTVVKGQYVALRNADCRTHAQVIKEFEMRRLIGMTMLNELSLDVKTLYNRDFLRVARFFVAAENLDVVALEHAVLSDPTLMRQSYGRDESDVFTTVVNRVGLNIQAANRLNVAQGQLDLLARILNMLGSNGGVVNPRTALSARLVDTYVPQAAEGFTKVALALINRCGEKPTFTDLKRAVWINAVSLARVFINPGGAPLQSADVNVFTDIKGSLEMFNRLRSAYPSAAAFEAAINFAAVPDGETPLMSRWNTPQIAQTLIRNGARMDAVDSEGQSVLMHWVERADPDFIPQMLSFLRGALLPSEDNNRGSGWRNAMNKLARAMNINQRRTMDQKNIIEVCCDLLLATNDPAAIEAIMLVISFSVFLGADFDIEAINAHCSAIIDQGLNRSCMKKVDSVLLRREGIEKVYLQLISGGETGWRAKADMTGTIRVRARQIELCEREGSLSELVAMALFIRAPGHENRYQLYRLGKDQLCALISNHIKETQGGERFAPQAPVLNMSIAEQVEMAIKKGNNSEEDQKQLLKLLEQGYDPNEPSAKTKRLPLTLAVEVGNLYAIEALVKYGANPLASVERYGTTAWKVFGALKRRYAAGSSPEAMLKSVTRNEQLARQHELFGELAYYLNAWSPNSSSQKSVEQVRKMLQGLDKLDWKNERIFGKTLYEWAESKTRLDGSVKEDYPQFALLQLLQ